MPEVTLNVESNDVKEEKYKDWEIEDAARTLLRAEEIKQDKELMALVAPKLKKTSRSRQRTESFVRYRGRRKQ